MKKIEFKQDFELWDELRIKLRYELKSELRYELWNELRDELYWNLEEPIGEISSC